LTFYKYRFSSANELKMRLDNVVFAYINREENDFLVRMFSKEEIKKDVWIVIK